MTTSQQVAVNGHSPLELGHCRVIAEAGVNHNNSVDRAIEMAEEAARAGAWAIKFQLYKAGSICVRESPKYWHDSIGTGTQFEAFQLSDHLEYAEYKAVAEACHDLGIVFFATPFDREALAALEEIGVPLYKVASGDITHKPLLEELAATGKPIVLSTGAATESEIGSAVEWLNVPSDRLILLVCTLSYPTTDRDGNFSRISTMRERFPSYLTGVSDHTLGTAGGWIASALGAVCIEKHFTLDKRMPDIPDHRLSLDGRELAELVCACDRASLLLGAPEIVVREAELPARTNARRSIVAARDIEECEILVREQLAFKRPAQGKPPWEMGDLVGRRALHRIEADDPIRDQDVA